MHKSIPALFVMLVLAAVGCSKSDAPSSQASKPAEASVPTYSDGEILALNKADYSELQRRCFGSQHATCVRLKSDSFKDLWEFKKSMCDVDKAKNAYQQSSTEVKDECKKFYD